MIERMKTIAMFFINLFSSSDTGYDRFDRFVDISSLSALILAAVAMVIFIIMNPGIRKGKRVEDRYMFRSCIVVLCMLFSDILLGAALEFESTAPGFIFIACPLLGDFLYMLTIFQWMIFVDYSLYRSEDHIKRCYRHAAVPILVVMAMDVTQSIMIYGTRNRSDLLFTFFYILQYCGFVIELIYILKAVKIVREYERESREPRFLSLSAFIIHFILGNLFRWYDAAFLTLGLILTYSAVKRRDEFLDRDTGFFNAGFLKYRGKYRDEKEYKGGNGILIEAPGHGEEMAKLLEELKPAGSSIFSLSKDRYLIISEALRGSAAKLAVSTLTEAAEESPAAFTPRVTTVARGRDESAEDFAERLLA